MQPDATLPVTLIMLEAVRDWQSPPAADRAKPAGGIKTSKDALKYLVMVSEIAGDDWMDPDWFRFVASSLLNDLLLHGRSSAPAPTPATTSPSTRTA